MNPGFIKNYASILPGWVVGAREFYSLGHWLLISYLLCTVDWFVLFGMYEVFDLALFLSLKIENFVEFMKNQPN